MQSSAPKQICTSVVELPRPNPSQALLALEIKYSQGVRGTSALLWGSAVTLSAVNVVTVLRRLQIYP